MKIDRIKITLLIIFIVSVCSNQETNNREQSIIN